MDFLNAIKNEGNVKRTENEGLTHKTSMSNVLDYFAQGSALRGRTEMSLQDLVNKSVAEDPLLTMKILFYSRDVRGGQGERTTFRLILTHLANTRPELVRPNLHLVPFYGRWDDLFCLLDTSLKKEVMNIIATQLHHDLNSETPSLLGKWMKSENTSSKNSRSIATKLRKALGLTAKEYRVMLSTLRKKINIVETKLAERDYNSIDYSKLPSGASLKYRQAFAKNDSVRYGEYLNSLVKGETKVNAKTLFPYELVRNALRYPSSSERVLYNEMWKNLPDYVGEDMSNAIAVIDTSYSMEINNSVPLHSAIALGLYIAEKNKGKFGNHFFTFDSRPQLIEIKGKDFCDKVDFIKNADWGGSTNIEATFDMILRTAVTNNLSQEEIPERLFIISDMEFDKIDYNYNGKTIMQVLKQRFESFGYKLPKLVFWNVNSKQDNIPMTMNEEGVQLVSGSNPSLFEAILSGEFLGAYELMLKVIDTPRYSPITIE